MKSNILLHSILVINIFLSPSYAEIQRTSTFDISKIHTLRSEIPRGYTIEIPDGSVRQISRCDFVVLHPDAAHIDSETVGKWNNLYRTSILTIPVAFHIIHKTDNTGYIEESKLTAQIAALNAAYASLEIQFTHSSTEWTANNDWFGIACGNFTQSECETHSNHCVWNDEADIKCQEENIFEHTIWSRFTNWSEGSAPAVPTGTYQTYQVSSLGFTPPCYGLSLTRGGVKPKNDQIF